MVTALLLALYACRVTVLPDVTYAVIIIEGGLTAPVLALTFTTSPG